MIYFEVGSQSSHFDDCHLSRKISPEIEHSFTTKIINREKREERSLSFPFSAAKKGFDMELGIVRKIDIDTEMQQSYLDYAMSVIVARALPDARDGLKLRAAPYSVCDVRHGYPC
ncbi:hypothetical protein [Candidatus Villigracilis affinis]|uniref:hypothetical protein n=1 Tax=Candidatus Villigracilis affinis TaxID=3140682 RepID=UPI001D91C308|nr:hypothetical protein [Anaerolineales bacterium]